MKNIIILAFCFLVTTLGAQQNNFANWTHHQLLDDVNDIAETENDMWFATNVGLVRMNKTTLDNTIYHPYNSPLPQQHIEAVAVDANGQLFIGLYDNIMARFDGGDDWEIIDVPVDENMISGMPLIYTIFIDNDNEKWLGTTSGLLHYQADGTWEIFNDETIGNSSISFADVWDITQTDNGDLFISSLEIYKYDGTEFTNLSTGNSSLFSYDNTSIDSEGNDVWFNNIGPFTARYRDDAWEFFETGEEDLPAGMISDLKIDQAGTPYVTYQSAGVGVYKFENEEWTQVDDSQVNGITEGISSIYFDENGERWLTADGEVYKDTQISLQESPFKENLPRVVKESPDGSIYLSLIHI